MGKCRARASKTVDRVASTCEETEFVGKQARGREREHERRAREDARPWMSALDKCFRAAPLKKRSTLRSVPFNADMLISLASANS